jgi:dTDP-4-dehydrorhamnose 3,5-epimerase
MGLQPFLASTTAIDGLWSIRPRAFDDERGVIRELYRRSALVEAGLTGPGPWAQVNITETRQGAVRGLHGELMHKLVSVAWGEAFGAWLDARPDSASRGVVVTQSLRPGEQVLVPPGVCNGFQAVSPGVTQYVYCFDREWEPDLPGVAVHPLDPDLAIPWPLAVDEDDPAMLSAKDAGLPRFAEL